MSSAALPPVRGMYEAEHGTDKLGSLPIVNPADLAAFIDARAANVLRGLGEFMRDYGNGLSMDEQPTWLDLATLIDRFASRPPRLSAEALAKAGASAPESALAVRDVIAERRRQVEAEGWSPEHDDAHSSGQMARAAACYAAPELCEAGTARNIWPWDWRWWKPKDRRRDLVRAGALILAEIERLDRAGGKK